MAPDPRASFICSTVAGAIAPADQKDAYVQYLAQDGNGAISAFLDDGSITTLQASVSGFGTGQLQLQLSNKLGFPSGCEYQITLSKLKAGSVTMADIPANIQVSSVSHTPLASLYHSIKTVYGPMLGSGALEPKLQELVQQLQAGLGAAIRKGTAATSLVADPAPATLQSILTPLDEIDFWSELSGRSGSANAKVAQQVYFYFEPLRGPLESLMEGEAEGGWEGVKEVVDQVLQALRQVWCIKQSSGGWAMAQARCENFLRVTGAAIASFIQAQMRTLDIWTAPFGDVKTGLIGGSQILAMWVAESKALTQDWAMGLDNGGHPWEGAPFSDPAVHLLQERMEEIYRIRETHEELSKLLQAEEAQSLGVTDVFAPFARVPALQVSEFTAGAWNAAKDDYQRRMTPVEQSITQRLRQLFATSMAAVGSGGVTQPQQVFQDLRKYSGLLSMPIVASTLSSEKEALAKQIDKHLDKLQQEFDGQQDMAARRAGSGGASGGGTAVIQQIMWALQTQLKLSKATELLRLMLGPELSKADETGNAGASTGLRACLGVAQDLHREVEVFRQQQFGAWEEDTQEQLDNMSQWKNSRLMTFDSQNSHIKTHFNEQVVMLLREVRQLQSLGLPIKKEVLLEVDTAAKFYRYGMVLKQSANFYNNISTEMIPCQKPMMLKDAVEFEKVLMNPKDAQNKEITWRNAAALEGYVRRLSEVGDRLAERNRQLRKWHDVLRDKVVALMGTDLVRYKDRWASGVKEMRDIFGRLESEGYSRESQQVWRQYWDFQLYKSLEYQYVQGLECINKNLPEIEIKMVFRQHKLQYDPPLEEVRIKHHKDFLNTFLGLPLRMKGVSDLSERPGFFQSIVDSNTDGIAKVYTAAEALFVQLSDELRKFQDWLVLGTVDLEEYVNENLQEVADWELNFKMLKGAAKDAEKLPNEAKVDCYKISLLPVKAAVDEHMKKLQEALVASLRRKAVAEKEQLEEFMKTGSELFGRQAASVEDIGKSGQEARSMVDGLGSIAQVRRRIEDKNKLLRAMAVNGKEAQYAVVDMSDVNNAWESFTTQLQQFDAHLEEQKQQLAGVIAKQLDDFRAKVAGFTSRWHELKPKDGPSGNPAVVLTRIEEFAANIQELREESAKLQKEAEAFKLEVGSFEALEEVAKDVELTKVSWDRYAEFLRERNEMANKDWLSMRDQVWKIEDFLGKWSRTTEGKGADDAIAMILLSEIDAYKRILPYLKASMRGAGWEDSHWLQLFNLIGLKSSGPNAVSKETVTLAHFLDVADAIAKNVEQIKQLDAQAQGESMMRKALAELKLWGLQREFELSEMTSQSGGAKARRTALIKEWRNVMSEVGDHQSMVASLKQSPYFPIFKDEVNNWDFKFGFLQEGLGLLNQIQRKWVYLEPIFARGALPQQQQRFRNVDEEFRRVMAQLESARKVVAFAEIPGIRDKLPQMAQQLDVCQRALSDFLEEKRGSFPRFYFLGDDDLLEILGQSKNPAVIQSHLKKLFAGIHKVKFSQDQSTIGAMQSMETEVVEFSSAVGVTEQIESWLSDLTKAMKGTLMGQLGAVQQGRMQDEFKTASSQILCLKEAVNFTAGVEGALQRGGASAVSKLLADVRGQLQRLAGSDYTGFTLLQLKKQALVLDFIHYVDVCEQLIKAQVASNADWAWRRQLRYYAVQDGRVSVAMAEASFEYTWEYQGNAPKLVYTPLTDKCYLTLTQGMALGYGGNPYGPAGTGKTESVKALGQAMARQVLVFNCDEEFDFKSMGRIFVGLVKCGAWGCFDEFNRLDEEVLSAVSQQIQIIQGALREGAKQMTFMDKVIDVDRNAGIFVTLNPAGKGYGGRSKLPDNLKQLFRSIAMTVPDNELIAEVLLLSEGFITAKDLARKLIALFMLSRELLSPQQHYDWGLRALKTSLGIAGRELREARKAGTELDPSSEMSLIVRSVCATKLPTLTFDDNRRFRDLLADLFPGVSITESVSPDLEKALAEVAQALKLDLTPQQLQKIWQLHLACEQRIGVIIVGPSGSGKSTLWEVLEKAYEKLGRKPVTYKMNPKAMNRQQLLGSMNLDTREWSDGVLTAAARKVVKEPLEQRSWIICDGDVDPEWIESLNSVLDDNRLLTMPNGERIQFANNINFIFECHSLQFASPATVSRCGMIFLSDEAVDVDRMLKKWISNHQASDQTQMETWCKEYLHRALDWALKAPRAVETTKVGLLDAALSHLAMGAGTKHEFAVALARGLGANMTPETRADFLSDLSKITSEVGLLDVGYGLDPLSVLGDELREQVVGPEEGISLVQTEEVQRNLAMLAPWLKNREPFILVGPEGCGKSTLLEYCLKRIAGAQVAVVSCSAQTNAANVIQKLVQVCGKPVTTNQGKCLRPPDNARIILYLKDINLPRPDKYLTAQLVAFLQQLLTHEGYYDENLEFIRVERVQIIASINPPSTVGRHALSTRFTARVRIANMTYPDKDAMQTIYTQLLDRNNSGLSISAANLASCMIEVYNQVCSTFSVNDQPHYQFTPRDLTQWVQGLKRYDLDSLRLPEAVAHEACRVFRDRLVEGAAENFSSLLVSVLNSMIQFRGDISTWVCSTLGASAEDRMSGDNSRLRMVKWGLEDFAELVAEKLKSFEREFKELNMMLFPEVLERLARFDRVLSTPGGSLMLCGSSGVGRRSCMLLMAYMHHMEFFTPKMTKNYDIKTFRNDLKEVLKRAGVEGKPTMLFLEDYQILEPAFLEYVNSLLSGGEIPGLFSAEELAKELMPLESRKNEDPTYSGPPTLYAYFVYRIQINLHVVVSMDPSNELFRSRCESNPALITRASIQWLETWSNKGMNEISAAKLKEMVSASQVVSKAAAAGTKDEEVAQLMVQMHNMMGASVQPREYVAFVNLYSRICSDKRKQVSDQTKFLKGGLSKLAEAEKTVDQLSSEADKQRALLKVKQAEAEEALGFIQASMMQAADRSKEVEVLKKRQAVEETEMKQRRGGVEQELAEVQPLIDQARKAVGQIKKENIDEIRSLKMPPEAIRDVLEGVLMVLGQEDTSWNNMKKFLGSKAVKDEIVNYDARKITPEMRAKVEKLMNSKGNSFEQSVIYRVSVAAAPLAAWVRANMAYSKVLEKVAPLESELSGLQGSIEESARLITQYEQELKTCEQQVSTLKTDFAKKTSEAETLRVGLEKAEGTVNAARNLLDKLGGEKGRWQSQVKTLEGDLAQLPLHSLMTSAYVTYLPMLPEEARNKVQEDWVKLLGIQQYDLSRFMSTESEMLKWKGEGLPADRLSMQNAIIILNSVRTPLVIDPSSQASEWLKTHLSARLSSVETTTMHDPRFGNTLELAVRFGKTLIIQEADRIEPILYPLLRMDLDRQGPRFVVQIGDKQIDYNETFRLYLVTRNPEPYLPPDARTLIAPTNFTVTSSGLESQLLGLTIQSEQPELEAQKSQLLKTEEDLKVQLADLEKNLLETLANSTGNLLENKELLNSLNETKSKSNTIAKSLTESKDLQQSLDQQREVYRPIAQRGSAMYFLIKDLSTINHMYQFSLGAFLQLFRAALSQDSPPGNVSSRIAVLNDALLELVFNYVSRALFNADRLTFGMRLACNLQPGVVKPEEWNFFLGKVSVDASAAKGSPPSWLREGTDGAYALLAANFPQLVQTCELQDASLWAPWVAGGGKGGEASNPRVPRNSSTGGAPGGGDSLLPAKIAAKVSPFQALILVKSFQPDRLQTAMTQFVCNTLNIKSLAPNTAGTKQLLQSEANAEQPVLFITTPGADPSQELSEYANATVGRDRYHEVAMGQGQMEVAVNLLRESARSGDWLCLKNVHLAVSWLPSLEKEMYTLQKHENFRLFLTSESHNKFPKTLLEGALKVTFEAPPGMKKNMLRTYEGWSSEFVAAGSPLRAQLLFILAWFHAVVQERRNYIPQGWSKFYEFSGADLRSGSDIIDLATKDAKAGAQWQLLHGLLENAIYGGRVDNLSDAKVLRTYLQQYFNTEIVGQSGGGKVRPLPGSKVVVPTSAHRQDYLQLVQGLPDEDLPKVFSLPPNIERSVQQANSERVVQQLKQMSISRDAISGFNRAQWQQQLGPLLRLWETLMSSASGLKTAMKELSKGATAASKGGKGGTSPVEDFVVLERANGVQLVTMIDKGLVALGRVLKGQEALSSSVQKLGQALLADQVPGPWDQAWEGPESPIDYCRAVVARATAVEQWWASCKSGNLLTARPLDLSNLFHPGTFLNAMRQHTARQLQMPLDMLKLATCWDAGRLGSAAGMAIQVGGLQMQGAVFDGTRFGELTQDAPISRTVPPMSLAWIPQESGFPYGTAYMTVPIYTTQDRSKVLTEVQMPVSSDDEVQQWTLTGLALFLSA